LLSEVVANSLHGKVFDISQFVNPVCQPLLYDTDRDSTNGSHDQSSQGLSILDHRESSSVGSQDQNRPATSCTITYPVTTLLSMLISCKDYAGPYHKEQNVLNLLEEGEFVLCIG